MTSENKSPFNFGKSPLAGGGHKFGGGFEKRDTAPNPWEGFKSSGNVEKDSVEELDALAKGFRQRRAQEEDRFQNATDSRYYFVVCFSNNADRDEFLGSMHMGLQEGDWWINGYDLAKHLKVDIGVDSDAD